MRLQDAVMWVRDVGLVVPDQGGPLEDAADRIRALTPAPRTVTGVRDLAADVAERLLTGRADLRREPNRPPRPPADRVEWEGDIEQLAWYRSWHAEPQGGWGIYLSDWGLHIAADAIDGSGNRVEALRVAIHAFVAHEAFHCLVDFAITAAEMLLSNASGHPVALWEPYFKCEYLAKRHDDDQLEEALANAFALRAASLAQNELTAVGGWFDSMPGAYSRYGEFLADSEFRDGARELLQRTLHARYRIAPAAVSATPAADLLLTDFIVDRLVSQIPIYLVISMSGRGAFMDDWAPGREEWEWLQAAASNLLNGLDRLLLGSPRDEVQASLSEASLVVLKNRLQDTSDSFARVAACHALLSRTERLADAGGDAKSSEWDRGDLAAAAIRAAALSDQAASAVAAARERGPSALDPTFRTRKYNGMARDPDGVLEAVLRPIEEGFRSGAFGRVDDFAPPQSNGTPRPRAVVRIR